MAATANHVVINAHAFADGKKKFLSEHPAPHYMLFTADPDPATGESWCPDCRRAVGSVRSVVAASGGSLLEVNVGDKPAWKSPDHPFRHDPLQLKGVPSLLRVAPDGHELGRLCPELEGAADAQQAAAITSAFTAAHP